MSLIKCKECWKDASDSDKYCPHCGKSMPLYGVSNPYPTYQPPAYQKPVQQTPTYQPPAYQAPKENVSVCCPKCRSTQVSANKKGFSGTNAVAGAILTGGVGLLAGTIGSNKVKITCLSCGYTFNPGDKPLLPVEPIPDKTMMTALIVFTIFVALVTTIAIIMSKS